MVSQISQEFLRWVSTTQQQGHFNQGQAIYITNKFNETIAQSHGAQSFENRKNWFFNWVNENYHLTPGNKNFIIQKINRLISQYQPYQIMPNNPLQHINDIQSISQSCGFVYFYDQNNSLTYFLGNFYPSPLNYQGLNYQCVEGAFQAAKFHKHSIKQEFCHLNGTQAWQLAKKYQHLQRTDWFQQNTQIMEDLLIIKFSDIQLKNLLLATGSAYLVEHTPVKGRDNFWADDCDGTGANMLGKLLMKTRQHYGGVGEVSKNFNYDLFLQGSRI